MRFGYLILYVPDVEQTIDFYRRAFDLPVRMRHEDQYAELETGATVLAFASPAMAAGNGLTIHLQLPQEVASGTEVAFVMPDVAAAYDQAIAAGATAIAAPEEKPWGQTVAYVRDCNGLLIELCTPVEVEEAVQSS